MATQTYSKKLLSFPESFKETEDRFEKIIKKDQRMLSMIEEKDYKKVIKNGLFTHAIKCLITFYVESSWDAYVRKYGKNKTDGEKNE